MMNKDSVFDLVEGFGALWCGADMEPGDLAQAVQCVVERKMSEISVSPNAVQVVWPWLEKNNVKIMARFYLEAKKITEKEISDITVRINSALRQGAAGAQILLSGSILADLVEQVYVVRDDLFFNKDLSIGLDVSGIGPFEWGMVFDNLRKINASSVMFVFTKDNGNKSDFVGRIFAMLNAWNPQNKFNLHFAFGPNFMRIEQAQRLVQQVKPELGDGMRFWVNV